MLFVNAGIGGFVPIPAVTPQFWDSVQSVNLRGCFFAAQKALPLMGKGGSIVFTGSIGSQLAAPGNVTYAAAKAGLRAVARNFAAELLPQGIRVNMVSPGATETPILYRNPGMDDQAVAGLRQMMIANTPMKRMGHAGGDRARRAVPQFQRGELHHRHRPVRGRRCHRTLAPGSPAWSNHALRSWPNRHHGRRRCWTPNRVESRSGARIAGQRLRVARHDAR